jgi:hypothetical protein
VSGFPKSPMRETFGTIVVSRSSCFGDESSDEPAQPGDVAAGMHQARYEPVSNRIGRVGHDYGKRGGCPLQRRQGAVTPVTKISTFSRMSSAAISGNRSYLPSTERHSMTKSFPST